MSNSSDSELFSGGLSALPWARDSSSSECSSSIWSCSSCKGEKEAWVKATKAAEHLPWWDVGEGIRVGKDLSIILPSRHSQPSPYQLSITLLQVPTHAFLTKRAKPSSDWQLGYILPLKHIVLQDLSLDSFFLRAFLNSSLGTFSNSREIPPRALIDLKNQIRSKRSN